MKAAFDFKPFSGKQRKVLNWWTDASPVKDMQGIIADGAIRLGKTISMSLSFVLCAMHRFNGQTFALCGKTVGSLQRNVLSGLRAMLAALGYHEEYRRSESLLIVRSGKRENLFYVFGGRDERPQDLIQGITLAGVYLDEMALMPESFVNQATGRCSVEGATIWMNCNPASPLHYIKTDWIDKAEEKEMLYLHFTMDDNLSLSERVKRNYERRYVGVFYLRYIKGLWAVAEGLIYTMFDEGNLYDDADIPVSYRSIMIKSITVDYGTTNPCVFLECWDDETTIWVHREYRWDSRSEEAQRTGQPQKTDSQYADDMQAFMGTQPEEQCGVVVDPSAASFIAELRGRGLVVTGADNEVLDGIRKVSTMFANKHIRVNRKCTGLIKELNSYVWDDKAALRGEEEPVKQLDHAPDALRYKINSLPSWRTGIK